MSHKKTYALGVALAAIAAVAGASTLGLQPGRVPGLARAMAAIGGQPASAPSVADRTPKQRAKAPVARAAAAEPHIVVFEEPALATYRGGIDGLPAPARDASATGSRRLDVRSARAVAYVDWLRKRQARHEAAIARAIGHAPDVQRRMQHAVNAMVVVLGAADADRVRKLPGVRLVEDYREYVMDTDTGPEHIGAARVWAGEDLPAAYQGEGMVAGILDSGINFGSPSFAPVDPVDGYEHVNPLGADTYLGTCAPGQVDEGRCNDKLIGGYDFVCGAPGNTCGTANIREEPGFGDTNSHGSHVASTVAGNRRDVTFRGAETRISGVAPRANLVAFDICYTNTATGQGLCPNASAVAAVDQAVADGLVDVINYSIGGGAQPWAEAVSLAFLGAVDAGIYVATSTGNSGPAPNTLGHLEPWVASTAAAQHGRGDFAFLMQVTGPAPVPEPLTAMILNEGTGGVAHDEEIPAGTPLRVSAGIDSIDDSCVALPPGTFEGAIAVIRRGGCAFTIKAGNAAAAGAVAVVIANNIEGGIIPSVPGATIPVFGISQAEGDALRDFAAANPSATAMIGFPAAALPNTADALADFSSRGPAGSFDLLKPDVTAPGVSILAVIAGTTIDGFEDAIGLMNGTSMASPHHAGAVALVRQARPGWSVPEVKSALMMTATQRVFLEDEVTPAHPFARGSGRIRVDQAIRAGLVMDETADDWLAADPAQGGDPTTLNQPNLADRSCFESCTFTRTFRSVLPTAQTWSLQLSGVRGQVSPRFLKLAPGATATVQVTIDSSALPADGSWRFGRLDIRPAPKQPTKSPDLHLPIAIAVQPPSLLVPEAIAASVPAGGTTTVQATIGNDGGSTLGFTVDNTGSGASIIADALRGAVNTGYRATEYTDQPTMQAQLASDDFTLSGETRLTSIATEGFVSSGAALSAAALEITWSVFPDGGGVPAGNPVSSPGAAAWSYTASPTGTGVAIDGGNIALDLLAAGQDVVLPAGRYWLVVHTRGTLANRWVWFATEEGDGSFVAATLDGTGAGDWGEVTAFSGLSMVVDGLVTCGAPWLGPVSPSAGTLEPDASQVLSITILGGGLSAGTQRGYLCVGSNDPATPKAAARIDLTVTP